MVVDGEASGEAFFRNYLRLKENTVRIRVGD